MAQGQAPQLDTVLDRQKTEADKRRDKRIDEVFGTALPRMEFIRDSIKRTGNSVSDRVTQEAQRRIDVAKAKGSYESAQAEIRKEQANTLNEFYKRVISILKISGGVNEIIDNDQEFIDVSSSGTKLINSINLAEMTNTANGKILYADAHEENKGLFEITRKITNKETLTPQDYEYLAGKLVVAAGMKTDLESKSTSDLTKSLEVIRQSAVWSTIIFLSPGQRFEVAKKLVDKNGDKGIGIISELTKVRIFTIVQMDALLGEAKISSQARQKYTQMIRDGTYARAQESADKTNETAKTDMKKLFHTGFAKDSLTYKNVLFWEVGRYLLIGTALLNFIVNAKNKDIGGILFNVPMWASIAGTAYIYNDVTKGGLQQALGKKSKSEQKAYENKEAERKFEEKFTRYPQLANWFVNNLGAVNKGFEKVNPKHDPKEKKPITFADMGVPNNLEKDGRRGTLLEQTISEWYSTLYFDLGDKNQKDQGDYLKSILRGQTSVNATSKKTK